MSERITMNNPNTGRTDGTIAASMYHPVRRAILDALAEHDGLRFGDLRAEVEARTDANLWETASPGWYTTTVKLDLEARGLLRRDGSPQRLHLTPAGDEARTTTPA